MRKLRFAILGTGFWSRYQLAAWKELKGAECVALYNRTPHKAEQLAAEFNVPAVYNDPEKLIQHSQPDFLDVITDVDSHRSFVSIAAQHRIPVICQKPMAPTWKQSKAMVEQCRSTKTPFYIHENWRWQSPIRALHQQLASGVIGRVFRARIDYCNSFPVFENQPFLKNLEQFILTDIGSHILDTARFLFGEPKTLSCQTTRVHRDIKGEDVASVMMRMTSESIVSCHMSYASRIEHDRFPETFVLVEGEKGSIEVAPDFWIRTTTRKGTHATRVPPPFYPWADPRYALAHSSIVPCHRNLLGALLGSSTAETTGEDNLKTMNLIFKCYQSAATGKTIKL